MSCKGLRLVIVDDEAKSVLVEYQLKHRIPTRDEALELLLHEYGNMKKK